MSCRHKLWRRQVTVGMGGLAAAWATSRQGVPSQLCFPFRPEFEGQLVAPAVRGHVSKFGEALNVHA
eukprot:5045208-Pyramimonas_sp.AAC.1